MKLIPTFLACIRDTITYKGLLQVKDSVEALRTLKSKPKIIIGGTPVTQEFCDQIGADAYATDAGSAVEIANVFIGSN